MYETPVVGAAIPVPVPTPVAVNNVPTVLSAEPIKVKFVLPASSIIYSTPTLNAPAVTLAYWAVSILCIAMTPLLPLNLTLAKSKLVFAVNVATLELTSTSSDATTVMCSTAEVVKLNCVGVVWAKPTVSPLTKLYTPDVI